MSCGQLPCLQIQHKTLDSHIRGFILKYNVGPMNTTHRRSNICVNNDETLIIHNLSMWLVGPRHNCVEEGRLEGARSWGPRDPQKALQGT